MRTRTFAVNFWGESNVLRTVVKKGMEEIKNSTMCVSRGKGNKGVGTTVTIKKVKTGKALSLQ